MMSSWFYVFLFVCTVVKDEQASKSPKSKSPYDKEQIKGFKYEPSKWESVDESQLEAQG